MIYRAAKRFSRVEALGSFGAAGRVTDAADPISLQIVVTDSVDVSSVIEAASTLRPTSGVPDSGMSILEAEQTDVSNLAVGGFEGKFPYRAATGIWTYDLTPALYQRGKEYDISWRYEMTPGNLRVEHTAFIWNPPPPRARDSTHCVLYDNWFDLAGNPQPLQRVIIEQYQDTFALANRIDSIDVQTDVFGNWFAELPRGILIRVLRNDLARVITVPNDFSAILSQLPDAQPKDVRKDRFGYPLG